MQIENSYPPDSPRSIFLRSKSSKHEKQNNYFSSWLGNPFWSMTVIAKTKKAPTDQLTGVVSTSAAIQCPRAQPKWDVFDAYEFEVICPQVYDAVEIFKISWQ